MVGRLSSPERRATLGKSAADVERTELILNQLLRPGKRRNGAALARKATSEEKCIICGSNANRRPWYHTRGGTRAAEQDHVALED
jgi:hypothetical protein